MTTYPDALVDPGRLRSYPRGFTKARYDAYRGSMYSFFEAEFGVRMLKAQERIRAVEADAATAQWSSMSG